MCSIHLPPLLRHIKAHQVHPSGRAAPSSREMEPFYKTGSLSSGHFESLLELPLWLILLPTLGALHQSQIGSLAFHAHVSVPSVRRTCLVNSRPHKVPLCLLSALGEAPGMLPGLPERFYKDFAQPSQGQRPGHS
ncbi:uncharacterized protein LOC130707527 isoform X28 [Balaenoptera acutorostrata]|nr:uncharacterized protein LOC130707527 isoform X27 [Balaenoptera acutorostrata]XP_057398542.1 uncharacterized protein LOC130707527 isoform X28 [Balaenoptera acutorostrata]